VKTEKARDPAKARRSPSTHVRAPSRQPILVTGMHRAGTSWVGHMLCAGRDFIHLPEPLNVLNRQTIFPERVKQWYTYINEENEHLFLPYFQDAQAFRLRPIKYVRNARLGSPRDPVRIPKRWASFVLGRVQRRSLLIRDPFAVFSVAWFVERLQCRAVVVVVRHPLAVVGSLKRLGFSFDFNDLLVQPSLMRELEDFRPEIEVAANEPPDIVDQGSLLWRVIYHRIATNHETDGAVRVVRHEDLSVDPVQEFGRLYELLGLGFGEAARRTIEEHTGIRNPREGSIRTPFRVRLDSRANLANWKHRLSSDEIERILAATRPVADRFYAPDEQPLSERHQAPDGN
jgi:hypothetical protein